jgi:hypothetical protein
MCQLGAAYKAGMWHFRAFAPKFAISAKKALAMANVPTKAGRLEMNRMNSICL